MKYKIAIAILIATFIVLCAGIAKAQTPINVTATQQRVITWQVTTLPESFRIERKFEYNGTIVPYWGTTIPATIGDVACSDLDGDGTELCTYNFGAASYTRTYSGGVWTITYFDYGCLTGDDLQWRIKEVFSWYGYILEINLNGNNRNDRGRWSYGKVVWRVQSLNNGVGSFWSDYTIPVQP